MASKTVLFDLPNELFPFIFQYLRSIDILKAFSELQSARLQALIQPFIKRLDISQESNEWIQSYLPNLFFQNDNIALRVQMEHLPLISEYLVARQIQSIEIINWDFNFEFSNEIVSSLRRNLKNLSLTFTELGDIGYEDVQFFQSDSQLEHLTIQNCTLCYYDSPLEVCTRLTYLSVQLEGMQSVFIFIQHLPNLQELKVKIISQECFVQNAPDTNEVKPCKTLRAVTFTGWVKYFDHLESFFATFGSTIEYLFLEIRLLFRMVDGARLEHNLLDKMPGLASFNLKIFSTFSDDGPIPIETFQSLSWERFNPVVYWYDVHAQQHTLFMLPYKFDRFEHLSNEFASTCVSNRPITLSFGRVRTLSLINTTPLNLETFLLIKKVFRNVTTIELDSVPVHHLLESEEDEEEKVLSINEDLISNTNLQISSITKVYFAIPYEHIHYKTFLRLLRLFPNLVDLVLSCRLSFLQNFLDHKDEDDFIKSALARINQLEINSSNEEDLLFIKDIHYLFPNVNDPIISEESGE